MSDKFAVAVKKKRKVNVCTAGRRCGEKRRKKSPKSIYQFGTATITGGCVIIFTRYETFLTVPHPFIVVAHTDLVSFSPHQVAALEKATKDLMNHESQRRKNTVNSFNGSYTWALTPYIFQKDLNSGLKVNFVYLLSLFF